MNLSLAIIFDYAKGITFTDMHLTNSPIMFNRISFDSSSSKGVFNKQTLMVYGPDEMPADTSPVAFIKIGSLPDKERYIHHEYALIKKFDDPHEAINSPIKVFCDFEIFDKQLRSMIAANAPLQEIGQLTKDFFSNDFCLWSDQLDMVFHFRDPASRVDIDYYRPLADRSTVHDADALSTFEGVLSNPSFSKTLGDRKAGIFQAPDFPVRTIYYNIYEESQFLGQLTIDESTRPFKASDLILIEHIGRCLARHPALCASGSPSSTDALMQVMRELLYDAAPPNAYQNAVLAAYGWCNDDEYRCAVIEADRAHSHSAGLQQARSLITNLFSQSIVFDLNPMYQRIVAVIKARNWNFQHKIDPMRKRADFMGLKLAFSAPFNGFGELAQQVECAQSTFDAEEIWETSLVFFEHSIMKIMKANLIYDTDPSFYLTNGMNALYDLDQERKTELLTVVKALIHCNWTISQAQKLLGLSRTTMLNRIERFKTITGLDFSVYDQRLYLRFLDLIGLLSP